jgi:phospholipid/cholesterol/gamma-HCH transport system permease protein
MTLPNLQQTSEGALTAGGDWCLRHVASMESASAQYKTKASRLNVAQAGQLDTAGALLWLRLAHNIEGATPAQTALLKLAKSTSLQTTTATTRHLSPLLILERMGKAVSMAAHQLALLLDFAGRTLMTFVRIVGGKQRLRFTAVVHHIERTGLDAVPIVALLCFLVGAVVAYLGATVLRDFGASLFTVELVSFSFQREFGPLLAAILVAGRSGSAFTAELGTMRTREEVDAITSLGMDPIELLVVPRLTALLIGLPILTLISMLSGIVGGALVGSAELDISPVMFITRMQETSEARHFFVGIIKAPLFAILIALVGCLEGLKVRGSAEAVGRHTTSSVVQSIFLVIVFDALLAIFFMKIAL